MSKLLTLLVISIATLNFGQNIEEYSILHLQRSMDWLDRETNQYNLNEWDTIGITRNTTEHDKNNTLLRTKTEKWSYVSPTEYEFDFEREYFGNAPSNESILEYNIVQVKNYSFNFYDSIITKSMNSNHEKKISVKDIFHQNENGQIVKHNLDLDEGYFEYKNPNDTILPYAYIDFTYLKDTIISTGYNNITQYPEDSVIMIFDSNKKIISKTTYMYNLQDGIFELDTKKTYTYNNIGQLIEEKTLHYSLSKEWDLIFEKKYSYKDNLLTSIKIPNIFNPNSSGSITEYKYNNYGDLIVEKATTNDFTYKVDSIFYTSSGRIDYKLSYNIPTFTDPKLILFKKDIYLKKLPVFTETNPVPMKPGNIRVTASEKNGNGSQEKNSFIKIEWEDIATNEDAYIVTRSTDGVHFEEIKTLPKNTNWFLDTTTIDSINYSYFVIAMNKIGTEIEDQRYSDSEISTNSDTIHFTTSDRINGILPQKTSLDLCISPNPSSDFIHLKNIDLYNAVIYNQEGRVVISSTETEIEVSDLPKGFYFLKATDTSGILYTEKILIE